LTKRRFDGGTACLADVQHVDLAPAEQGVPELMRAAANLTQNIVDPTRYMRRASLCVGRLGMSMQR
jgi:hypothetical protein